MSNFGVGESFSIEEVYEWENELAEIYPRNRHIRETFRDIMQDFRDDGWIRFEDFEGSYRIGNDPRSVAARKAAEATSASRATAG